MQKLSMDQLNRVDVDTFKEAEKFPITVVLDNVRSLHNVGSTFRTADAFAIEKIILVGITGSPPHREIEKTALGATLSVEWQHVDSITEAIEVLKTEGCQILSIEQVDESISLPEFTPILDQKYAVIFGNEVHGVSEEALPLSDFCIEIPQFGTKHSLNVSVTVGIVLWDMINKVKFIKK